MAEKTEEQIDRELRRLALAGRLDEVRYALMEKLERCPNDTEAKAELQRLINGKPLRMTLSAEQRKQVDALDALDELRHLIIQRPIEQLRHFRNSALLSLNGKINTLLEKCKPYAIEIPTEVESYRQAIQLRLRQFSKKRTKKLIFRSSVAALALAGVGIIIFSFRQYAENKALALQKALADNDVALIKSCREAADTSFNRFFCKSIVDDINQADTKLYTIEKQHKSMRQRIDALANHPLKTDSLTAEALENLATEINALPIGRKKLQEELHALIEQTKQEREAKRNTAFAIINQPIPPVPTLSNAPNTDEKNLKNVLKVLQSRLDTDTPLVKAYQFSDTQLKLINHRIEETQQLLSMVQTAAETCTKLSKCRNYDEYCAIIRSAPKAEYLINSQLHTVQPYLPDTDDLGYRMKSPTGAYSRELLNAAEKTLVYNGPTFTDEFPATYEQTYLMEDLFTSPSLKNKIYAVEFPDKETWYTTIEPYVDDTNFLIIKRDIIDPRFSLNNSHRELQADGSVKINVIDATAFYESLHIDKQDFFITTNLPTLLTKVLNSKKGKHPALAQAYAYHCLMTLAEQNNERLLTGLLTSASMKEDFKSFSKTLKKSGIKLQSGCWLSTEAPIQKAEQLFAEWFSTHRGKDYAEESANAFARKISVTPDFCGYINENGVFKSIKAVDIHQPRLWYLDNKGSLRYSKGEPENPMPFSPVFSENRK